MCGELPGKSIFGVFGKSARRSFTSGLGKLESCCSAAHHTLAALHGLASGRYRPTTLPMLLPKRGTAVLMGSHEPTATGLTGSYQLTALVQPCKGPAHVAGVAA